MSTATAPAPVVETVAPAVPAWGWQAEAAKAAGPTAQDLWKRYHKTSDTDTENALVQKYIPLVNSVMGRLAMTLPDHVSHDDLFSAGLVGLLQALRNFDPAANTSFETYARVRVRGAMLDELRRMDWVPRTIHEKARKLKSVLLELEQKLGGTPTEAQMAKAMKMSPEEYQELLDEIRPAAFVCLDSVSQNEDGDGGALYEIIADSNGDSPMDKVSNNELKQVIFERLKELPEMQRKVLALYYIEDMHLREIAEVFGLTESRICQIHAQAIIGLRAFVQRFESGIAGKPRNRRAQMIIIVGCIVVMVCVFGGFMLEGGKMEVILHAAINEVMIIAGGAIGSLIIMSPKKVLMDILKNIMGCLKGSPYSRGSYEDLLKVLYELFMLGRRNGMIALEEHVSDPEKSSVFKKYPKFSSNHHAVEFLCGALRPIIDGKIKPDQLRMLLDVQMERAESEHHAPVSVLQKTGDAMPGFGIVAAVLGIVITMASISGPVEMIGEHVAAALVGTFLGILLAYGFMGPLATNMEFFGTAEMDYTRCIAACVTGFANGMAPVTAVELGRRGLSSEFRPTAEELEAMFKAMKGK